MARPALLHRFVKRHKYGVSSKEKRTADHRFAEKWVEADEPHPILGTKCWLWTGSRRTGGYGRIYLEGKTVYAHRASYELHVGPIQDGLHIDHLCRVRHCVNPEHLEPVTCRKNLMRGDGPTAQHATRTHCPRGHPYSGQNLYVCAEGKRHCRRCRRARP